MHRLSILTKILCLVLLLLLPWLVSGCTNLMGHDGKDPYGRIRGSGSPGGRSY